MQDQNIKVRKIGRKTYIYMFILIILGVIVFLLVQDGKRIKAVKILNELGYKNIINIRVYSVKKVEDRETRIQGYRYFVSFFDPQSDKLCKGFIFKDFKHNIDQDLDCIKEKNG